MSGMVLRKRDNMTDITKPSLFGIERSNRDFSDPYYWGKNQFNSSFPVALACYMRACVIPLVYVTYRDELGTTINEIDVADGMTYDNQNDKEFSISGSKSRLLMACERLVRPAITKSEIRNIVLGGGQKYLSPERRFDAIIYYSNDLFEDTGEQL